ncbi:hypothetical protein FHS22_002411 [Planomonospora venezuelensis]|uniref:Uncharacterized protein n=1 Tax=Planomonospora venezuelensis TaxID=1999 RepID=A0A841D420_PLAVE|nr:hypothetical protein [Planomonospora venezuelensis]
MVNERTSAAGSRSADSSAMIHLWRCAGISAYIVV